MFIMLCEHMSILKHEIPSTWDAGQIDSHLRHEWWAL